MFPVDFRLQYLLNQVFKSDKQPASTSTTPEQIHIKDNEKKNPYPIIWAPTIGSGKWHGRQKVQIGNFIEYKLIIDT